MCTCPKILVQMAPFLGAIAAIMYYNFVYMPALLPLTCNVVKVNCPTYSFDERVVAPEYEPVAAIYKSLFTSGLDSRSCVYMSIKNKPVIDICGSVNSSNDGANYRDQLQIVYSSTKVISATCIAILVDRGLMSYDDKVTKHWPAFGQGFKENVTVGDVVQHASGLLYYDPPLLLSEVRDPIQLKQKIETAVHNLNGTRFTGYHAETYGFIISELVKIVDPKHRDLSTFIKEEINAPLGVEFYLGRSSMNDEQRSRIERFNTPSLVRMLLKLIPSMVLGWDIPMKAMILATTNTSHPAFKSFNSVEKTKTTEELEEMPIAAMNGFTNARTLATVASIFANNGIAINSKDQQPVRILKEETVKSATENMAEEFDVVLQAPFTRTRAGFGDFAGLGLKGAIGWAGFGGSFIVFNPKHQIAFGYAMRDGEMGAILGDRASVMFRKALEIADSQ